MPSLWEFYQNEKAKRKMRRQVKLERRDREKRMRISSYELSKKLRKA
jgi:hypothetical protein